MPPGATLRARATDGAADPTGRAAGAGRARRRRRARRSRPSAPLEILASEALDAGRGRRAGSPSAARSSRPRSSARRGQARQRGLRRQGSRRGRRGRAREARALPRRAEELRRIDADERVPRRARAGRLAVRARADAGALRGARRAAAGVPHPARRRHERQVVGDHDDARRCSSAAGMRAGACISPHVWRWSERTRIGGAEIEPAAFAAAVERSPARSRTCRGRLRGGRADHPVRGRDRRSRSSPSPRRGVDVAVIEAGLGGRLDATNVIPSEATALTSVGLDHTEWLGEHGTRDRGREARGAAAGDGARLGAAQPPSRAPRASDRRRAATPRGRSARRSTRRCCPPASLPTCAGTPPSPRRWPSVVARAARASARSAPGSRRAALPGRAEVDPRRPAAARRRRPQRAGRARAGRGAAGPGRRAAGRRLPLGPRRQGRRRRSRAALAPGARRWRSAPRPTPARRWAGPGRRRPIPSELAAALRGRRGRGRGRRRSGRRRRARARRSPRDRSGVALCAGSHYLLRLRMDREARSELLSMMGLVAAVVAIVILVFFGLGYLFGRLFL